MKSLFSLLCLTSSAFAASPVSLSESPWPKFRHDLAQTGRSPLFPTKNSEDPWVFKTSKGLFSSAVIGAHGEIYIGSADRTFYALSPEGKVLWQVPTGEIIDSSALLDNRGRIYFGSGDGILRARDAESGDKIWDFAADQPSATGGIINWFEGNVAMGLEGTLYAPNDNFRLYAIDSESGSKAWHFPLNDQSWSSPAVDAETGNLYFGSNFIAPLSILQPFWKNIFALDSKGKLLWRQSVQATVAASPMLSQSGLVVVGAFDGTLYAYDKKDGKVRWTFSTQDHLYASASEQADGTIIQASTDGHVYALEGKTGELKWSFASGEPIRSSPAIDGAGNIYYGSGDGALYVLNADGTLRFRMQLIQGDRNDLNASPALSSSGVVLAGENGEIWSIPYDYCLTDKGLADTRCSTAHTEPADGVQLSFITPFGSLKTDAPGTLAGGESLVLALNGVKDGKPVSAVFREEGISIVSEPPVDLLTRVSGDGKSLVIHPKETWPSGGVTLGLNLPYDFQGKTSAIQRELSFTLKDKASFSENAGTYVLRRLAVPIPTIMPSYNQIGFDSLSYVIRLIEADQGRGTAWVMAGKEDAEGRIEVDPGSEANFALAWHSSAEGLVLESRNGFSATAMNLNIPFSDFRLSLIEADGEKATFGALASTICKDIPTYGYFLKNLGFCSAKEGRITLVGAAEIRPLAAREGEKNPVSWRAGKTWLNFATIEAEVDEVGAELYSLILIDDETHLPIDVAYKNLRKTRKDGKLILSLPYASGPDRVKAVVLKNTAVISEKLWLKKDHGVYQTDAL